MRARVLAMLALVVACERESPAGDAGAPRGPAVQSTRVSDHDGAGFVAVVVAESETDLAPPFEGTLLAVDVEVGDVVTVGQVVARIDTRLAREELAAAEAAASSARALLREAEVAVADAHRIHRREEGLVASRARPAAAAEDARFALARARAARDQRRALAREAETRAAIARSQVELGTLRAPFAARVAARHADVGAQVGPTAAVLRLVSDELPRVRFAVPPSEGSIAPGIEAWARCEPGIELVRARVSQVAPEVDPASEQIYVDAELENGSVALHPGLGCRVFLAPDMARAPP